MSIAIISNDVRERSACLRFALWGSKYKDVRNAYRYRVQLYYGKKTPGGASGTEPYVTRLDDSKIVLLFGKALNKLHHLFVPSRHTLRVAPSAFA